MIRVILWRLLAFILRARYESITGPDGSPYLDRWHFPTWLARWYGARQLFLHRFRASDPDRGWHNHPWEWCEATLLDGVYVQECLWLDVGPIRPWPPLMAPTYRVATDVYHAGETNRLTSQFHAIRLLTPVVWTLFKAGAKHGKSWGFKNLAGEFRPANLDRGAMH